jgi:hypothetical protein
MEVTSRTHATTIISQEMVDAARELRMHPVHIVCDATKIGARSNGDRNGVSFIAAVYEIPRVGERLMLEDGEICEVLQVVHKVGVQTSRGDYTFPLLLPTVYAWYIKQIAE